MQTAPTEPEGETWWGAGGAVRQWRTNKAPTEAAAETQSPADSRETASIRVSRQRRSLESATVMLYGIVLPELLFGFKIHLVSSLPRPHAAVRFLSLRGERNQRRAGVATPRPRGCPAFPSPPTFPSALGRLVPLGSLNAGPFTGTLAILRLRKFLRIFWGTARR